MAEGLGSIMFSKAPSKVRRREERKSCQSKSCHMNSQPNLSFIDSIKDSLNNDLPKTLKESIDSGAASTFASLPLKAQIDNVASVYYGLTAPPVLTDDFLLLEAKGEVYSNTNPTEAPVTPPMILPKPQPDLPFHVLTYFSSFMFESAAWVYMQAGVLQKEISTMPGNSSQKLGGGLLAMVLPAMTKYSHNPIRVKVEAVGAPVNISIQPGGLKATIDFSLTVEIDLGNNKTLDAFSLNNTLTTVGAAWVVVNGSGNFLMGNFSTLSIHPELTYSHIGEINVNSLSRLLNYFAKTAFVPDLNKQIACGMKIPMADKVELINPMVSFEEGFIRVGANLSYVG
eukprot:m.90740 g.90740  ORF g.90740 m.90740 type:complete len:341 (-) comp21601_c0_seq3:78-1100(-)